MFGAMPSPSHPDPEKNPRHLRIVLPVYNEAQSLASVVDALTQFLDREAMDYQIVLAENGSTDSSPALVDNLASHHPRIKALHLPEPDYGRALQQGFLSGASQFAVNFSVDFVDPEFLRQGLARMSEFDIVMGSKYVAGNLDRRPIWRRLGGMMLGKLAAILFRLPIADTHGIMVLRSERVMPFVAQCRSGHETFDTELMVRSHRAGLAITEIPVHVRERRPCRLGVARRAGRMLIHLVQLRIALWKEGLRG